MSFNQAHASRIARQQEIVGIRDYRYDDERQRRRRQDAAEQPNGMTAKETLFWWMRERERIRRRKEKGLPKPWTSDEILQTNKFTNVYRDMDKVSRDLKEQVLDRWSPKTDGYESLLVRDVIAYRLFNHPETWCRIWPLLDDWDEKRAIRTLKRAHERGHKIFTGAYVCGNNGESGSKIEKYCGALTVAFAELPRIVQGILAKPTIENATLILQKHIPFVGMFVAYEFASDLRLTPLLSDAPDIMTWANPGKGAQRGLRRINGLPAKGTYPRQKAIDEMRELLAESQQPGVLSRHMRPLEMRDIEHSLCETDKYLRILNGEGKTRSRYAGI
jgi:hypothetical protein